MEIPHVFGEFDHLIGVVNQPTSKEDVNFDITNRRQNVGVMMLTAGMLHHVGPFRLYVNLARALAERGVTSLRFDLSGIGESLPVASVGTSLERAAHETGQALDFLQQTYGIERFVLFGLCSGADDGFHTALQDERVDGVVLLDGCGYRTKKFYRQRLLSHYLPRLLSPRWLANRFKRASGVPSSLAFGDDIREFPSRDEAAHQIQQLIDRGVKMNFIYTGGVADYYNHDSQFCDMFADVEVRGQVTSRYFPQLDHVGLLCEDRQLLVDEIMSWIVKNFRDTATSDLDSLAELVAV